MHDVGFVYKYQSVKSHQIVNIDILLQKAHPCIRKRKTLAHVELVLIFEKKIIRDYIKLHIRLNGVTYLDNHDCNHNLYTYFSNTVNPHLQCLNI